MLQCYACKHVFEGDPGVKCPNCSGIETIPVPDPPPSAITIKFAAPGSTVFRLEIEGKVTPGQLIVAGQMMMDEGRMNGLMPHILEAVAEAVASRLGQPKIAVPGMTQEGVQRFLKGIRDD